MNRRMRLFVLTLAAFLLGLGASELLCRSTAFRDLAGYLGGRGHLIAISNQTGIYETDLGGDDEPGAADLIAVENLRHAAAHETISQARIDREIDLLKAQFGDDKNFEKALRAGGLTVSFLREKVTNQLRGLDWLEKQIRLASTANENECRQFYDARRDLFAQPLRYRASHLFLAAHAETPPEDVEEKEKAISAFSARLSQGEALSQLAAEASEDEASKPRGGDLGYFSETRMPPEFMAEIKKLRVGEISKPIRSHLGFHIAQLTDIKPAHFLTFEEARPEISVALANERRTNCVDQIARTLSRAD
jgi:parvulin-like peptidyl-prolyl isomerase